MISLNKTSHTVLSNIETLNRLRELNINQVLNPQLAAIMLGLDERTLARYRMNGTGPVYIKADPEPGSKAVNQKVGYVIEDLLKWQNDNKIHPTKYYAIREAFQLKSLKSLNVSIPFIVCMELKVHLPFHLLNIDLVIQLITNHGDNLDIHWKTLGNCLLIDWSDTDAQAVFKSNCVELLKSFENKLQMGTEFTFENYRNWLN